MSPPFDAVYVCIACGAVESTNPQRYAYDEYLCEACDEEQADAEAWLQHMQQVTGHKQ